MRKTLNTEENSLKLRTTIVTSTDATTIIRQYKFNDDQVMVALAFYLLSGKQSLKDYCWGVLVAPGADPSQGIGRQAQRVLERLYSMDEGAIDLAGVAYRKALCKVGIYLPAVNNRALFEIVLNGVASSLDEPQSLGGEE